jgi:uncharacterized protein YukE
MPTANLNDNGLLLANYDALHNAANQLSALHSNMMQLNTDLLSRSQNIAGSGNGPLWGGQAATLFAAQFMQLSQSMQGMLQRLEAANASIPTIIAVVQNADSTGASLFNTGE